MVSNSAFCTNMYKNSFWYNNEIIEVGSPRNDVLLNADVKKMKEKVCDFFRLSIDTNLLLYAPTFRDNYEENPYNIDFKKVINLLENKTKKKWVSLIRLHPRESNPERFILFSNQVINATSYKDVQELILACKLLITDYSSTMFEAMIANKDVILYANDIEKYNDERGTYFSFDELPFDLATNNEQLLEKIDLLGNNSNKYKSFKEKIGLKESGESSKIIAKIIEGKIYG